MLKTPNRDQYILINFGSRIVERLKRIYVNNVRIGNIRGNKLEHIIYKYLLLINIKGK